MRCIVCGSEKEVKKLGTIYTIGSEGTDLCLDCRIMVSNYIRSLMSLRNSVEKEVRRKLKSNV